MTAKNTINMILTSLVNNNNLLEEVVGDIKSRFKISLDVTKLQNLLNVVEVNVDDRASCTLNEN